METIRKGIIVGSLVEGLSFAEEVGYPVVVLPSFTLKGAGGGVASNSEEMDDLLRYALDLSPVHEALIEEIS